MKLCDFTLPEVRYFLQECNFTKDERVLFELRTKDIPLEQCAEQLEVSLSTANRINKRIKEKVRKIEVCKSGITRND